MSKDYVLAIYDVRGKQDYIFRGRKMKEIVGASLVIRDIYKDYLLDEGDIYSYNSAVETAEKIEKFSWADFEKRINDDNSPYVGEVIYDGGGNFLVLFKNKEVFEQVTHRFTFKVLRYKSALRVVGTCIENLNPDDYEADRKRLYREHRNTEHTIHNLPRYGSLPISEINPVNSMPIVYKGRGFSAGDLSLSAEQLAKYQKQFTTPSSEDNLMPDDNGTGYIAIIYIDGNGIGGKVQECTKGLKTYDECILALRRLSFDIQKECVDDKMKIIDEALSVAGENTSRRVNRRMVLGAGDEINLVVPANKALVVVEKYLNALNAEQGYSACAGIAIMRSHMPYSDAYRIAEQCCESGKKKMREHGFVNTSFVDFHVCQGAIGISLDQIRRDEQSEDISRPWLMVDPKNEYKGGSADLITREELNLVLTFVRKIGRTNAKKLVAPAREGVNELEMELRRIRGFGREYFASDIEKLWEVIDQMDKYRKRKIIYDVVSMYDMWFADSEG